MSFLITALIAAVVIAAVLLLARWRRGVLRAALSVSDERMRTLTITEITRLRGALTDYLATADGAAIKEHPSVTARLTLFDELLDRDRRRRALAHAGLTPKDQETGR